MAKAKFLLLIGLLMASKPAWAQKSYEYPYRPEAASFVQWFTSVYWDSLELRPFRCLISTIEFPAYNHFLKDDNGFLYSTPTYRLASFFGDEDLQHFRMQLDSLAKSKPEINLSAYMAVVVHKLGWDSMSPDTVYKELAAMYSWNKDSIQDTLSNEEFWNSEFVDTSMQIFEEAKSIFMSETVTVVRCGNRITWPVFSKDMKYAVINFSHYCGKQCGYSRIMVFRKTPGGWAKELVFDSSVDED